MSDFRLLVAIEVIDFVRTLRKREQEQLLKRFRDIAAYPSRFCDFFEYDAERRRVGVHIFGKFALKFWDDSADRHVKILDIHLADRGR